MLDSLRNAWKIPDLRKRFLFTLAMFLVFRVGTHIPVPGLDPAAIEQLFQGGTIFGFLDLFSGGALSRLSIFALNIYPYITASIIMTLLTIIVPSLEKLSKEGGEEGRKKMSQYTRYATVLLAFVNALGLSFTLRGAVVNWGFFSATVIITTLIAGTVFLMWMGEQITEKGIGNGISLMIFAGIVSRLPIGFINIVTYLRTGRINIFNLLLLAALGAVIIAAVIVIQEGTRRIPVQYAKRVVGRKVYGGQSTHIPIKVNQAGVIPIIFASSVLAFPLTLAQFVPNKYVQAAANHLAFGTWLNSILYVTMIIFFTYFYTAITFNPIQVADNMKKYGGFVPGLRPGRPTADYLNRVLMRITLVGAVFLAIIAVFPDLFAGLTGIPGISFGGTSLLIIVGVATETMRQIEAQMLMRHYQGFLK
ncbi:MAG: preprotein translocase subunit SecY [bacterium]